MADLCVRRNMLFGFGGLLIGAVRPSWAIAQDGAAPGPATPSGSLATRTDADTLLTVKVAVNGAGPFRFIVDTGAERTIVADTIAAQLGLETADHVNVSGLARQVIASVAAIKLLTYGPFTKADLAAPVLPFALIGADGILGLDVIHNARVVFDFKHHLLGIDRVNNPMADADPSIQTVIVRAKGNGGRLRMSNCQVDGVEAQTFVDTGAEVSVCNSALYRALLKRNPKMNNLGEAVLTGVTGGEIRGPAFEVSRIDLQSIIFNGGALVAADVDDFAMWGLTDPPALLIGMNFLRQFAAITIDFRSKEVKFALSQD